MGNIIAFSGTHGTGKSTCAYNLAAKLKLQGENVVVLDELARECPLPINKKALDLSQYWILASQIKREVKLMTKYNYIICDRSLVDTIAYGSVLNLIEDNMLDAFYQYIDRYYKDIYVLDPIVFN